MSTTVAAVQTMTGDPAWRVTGYETVKRLLADPRLGRSHPEPQRAARYSASVMFGRAAPASPTERQDHEQMRRLLGPPFSPRRLAQIKPRVQQLVDELLDRLADAAQPANFHELVSFPLPALVICELLGVPYEDRDRFRRWSDDAADTVDEDRSMAGVQALRTYMRGLLRHKRAQPAEDVLSDLVGVQEHFTAFGDEDVVMLAAGLLFAGHETTVATIDKGVLLLLSHPEQRKALQRDPRLTERAVEEVLRCPLEASVDKKDSHGGLPRYANADVCVAGTTIKAGDLVLLDLEGANLDEQLFSQPGDFEVTRADNPHLTFGYGPYYCLGAPLARIELQTLFGSLFGRFPTLQLAVPLEQLPRRTHTLTGGFAALPVTW